LVKGWPAARLLGKWQAKISMDGVLAKTKEFFVGSENRRYEQTIKKDGALSIGVYPFFVDTESTYGATFRANDSLLPLYLSQVLTIDFEAHRVVMPFELRKGTANPKVKYDDLRNFLVREVKSPDSEWNAMVKKHKLDLVLAGKVYDTTTYEEEKEATIYLIRSATNITETKATYKALKSRERTGFDVRANFYREIYDQIVKPVADSLK
jgi:hypothetical protein